MTDWEKFSEGFLSEYLETLMKSMEKHLDEETRIKILNETGKFCARAHATELFKQIKAETKDFPEFIVELNKKVQGTNWEILDDKSVKITYSKCFCPIVDVGLHKLPVQCDCSAGWIKHNLETVLEKPVKVTINNTVLRGASECEFVAKY
ncbi:MAG: hypothetical protein ACTSSK_06730 [Candidatus Heimdallarchaeota archaeon]